MAKSKKTSLTTMLSVAVLLVCLLLSIVNVTGAWFTDESGSNKTLSVTVQTGEMNVNVYQEYSDGSQVQLSKLPSGYTQVEYIQVTGTQYIDTGFLATPNTVKYETTISFDDTTGTRGVFGARASGTGSQAVNVFCISGNMRLDWADSASGTNYAVATNTIYNLTCYQNAVTVNGVKYTGSTTKSSTKLANTFHIGNFGGSGYSGMIGKIYVGRLYDNGTLIGNYVPCKYGTAVGLFNTVDNTFHGNSGSGTITAGPEKTSETTLNYDVSNVANNLVTPGQQSSLKLVLKNEDYGESVGIKFKVEFYVATPSGAKLVPSTIYGMDAPSGSTNGWVKDSDGYYYYRNSSGKNVVFEKRTSSSITSKVMMTGFAIDASALSLDGVIGGNSLHMVLTVENVTV